MGIGVASKLDDFGMDPEVRLSLDPEGTQQIGLEPEDLQESAYHETATKQDPQERQPRGDAGEPEPEDMPSAKHVRRQDEPDNSGQLPEMDGPAGKSSSDPLADYFMPEQENKAELARNQPQVPARYASMAPLETYIAALSDEIAESADPDAERVTMVTLKMLAEAVRNELDQRDSSRDAMLKDIKNMVVDEAIVHYRKGSWEPASDQGHPRQERQDAGRQTPKPVSVTDAPAAQTAQSERAMPPSDDPHAETEEKAAPDAEDTVPAAEEVPKPKTIELPETKKGVPVWAFIAVAVILIIAVVLVAASAMTAVPISALPSLL